MFAIDVDDGVTLFPSFDSLSLFTLRSSPGYRICRRLGESQVIIGLPFDMTIVEPHFLQRLILCM